MQKHLILLPISPHVRLTPRHALLHIDPHPRRPTDKNTRPLAKLLLEALHHVRDIGPPVLGAPALFLAVRRHGRHEGETHEVFLEHGRSRGEAEVEVTGLVACGRSGVGRDLKFEGRFVAFVGWLGWGRKVWLWEGGDAVFVFAAEFLFFFRVAGGFVTDEGRVAFAGYALEGAVDAIVEVGADGAGVAWIGAWGSLLAIALCGCDEELAVYSVGRSVFAANSEFFFEPFHGFRAFESPDNVDLFCDGFAVSHAFDEIEELADDSGDAAATCKKYDGVKSSQFSVHSTIRAVYECTIRLIRAFLPSSIYHFSCEASERSEN